MANTTWSPTDKSAAITLSNVNLTAAASSGVVSLRAIDKQFSGKFYFEHTLVTANSNGAVGLVTGFAALGTSTPADPSVYMGMTGTIWVNNASTGIQLGSRTTGDVLGIAVDFTNRLIWFRVAPSGNWNNSGTASPGTGTGGVAFGGGVAYAMFPWAYFNTAHTLTANFGDSAFTGAVPAGFTSGFPAAGTTVLLVHCDGTNGSTTFTDVSPSAHVLTSTGGATVSTSQVKFGTGSSSHTTGTNPRITTPGSSDFDFQSGQFTIECWGYPVGAPVTCGLISQYTGSSGGGWFFGTVSANIQFRYQDGAGTLQVVSTSTAPPANAWAHYAVDRDAGGTLRLYINGVVAGSASAPTFQAATPQVTIGNTNNLSVGGWPGYIDEIRITKGAALYAGAFTPPTAPFTVPGTNVIATQAAVELWADGGPVGQITQALLEMWASTGTVTGQALVTQASVEMWASVIPAAPAFRNPIVFVVS
jgi:hypothetical protein